MTGDALARLRTALGDHGCAVNGNGAQCPAHEDRTPSLSINPRKDGRGVVFDCKAGCDPKTVLDKLGLDYPDLYDDPPEPKARPQVVAEYPYPDETGRLLYTIRRYEPGFNGKRKDFRPVLPDGTPRLGRVRRVPYRLPELLKAVASGETIHITEGCKDADAIVRAGGAATCNPGGVGSTRLWSRPDFAAALRGADVVVVADRDEPGRRHAEQVRASLTGVAASVRVVEAASGKDASDHLAAGHGLDDFAAVGAAGQDEADAEVDALIAELLDTGDLDHIPALEPLIADVLYLDTVARMWGESGAFKSFVALDFAASVGTGTGWHGRPVRQGLVIYLVAEGVKGIRRRVRAWEQHHGREMTGVKFLPRPVQVKSPEWPVLITACQRLRPALIIADTQARMTVGVEENSATEMGVVLDMVERLRAASGACVLLIHHTGLNGERGRGSTAIKGGMQTELGVSRAGKGLPDIRVTLKTSKQKDDEEPADLVFALRQIRLTGEAKPDGSPLTSIVLIPAGGTAPPGTEDSLITDIITRLDNAGVPAYGRDKTREEAAKLGISLPGNDALAKAVRCRKKPRMSVPDRSGQVTCPDAQDSFGVSADQTCPGQVQDSTGQAEAGPVLVPVSLETGQVGQPAPGIPDGHTPGCDKRHDTYGEHATKCARHMAGRDQ